MLNRLSPRVLVSLIGAALLALRGGKRARLKNAAVGAAVGFGVASVAPGVADRVASVVGSAAAPAAPRPVGVIAQVKG